MATKAERSDSPSGAARNRGRRLAFGALAVVTVGFIGISTWELQKQVFSTTPSGPPVSAPCGGAIRAFQEEIDRALSHAAITHDREAAHDAFEEAIGGGAAMSLLERRCSTAGPDRDALVAAQRFREAAESAAVEQAANLTRLRRALEARAAR